MNINSMECKQIEAELKWIESGQRHPYGDMFYTCEIHTTQELTDEDILDLTKEKGRLPYEEWKVRGANSFDDYFKGYYTIEKTDYGYLYKGVYPYDD